MRVSHTAQGHDQSLCKRKAARKALKVISLKTSSNLIEESENDPPVEREGPRRRAGERITTKIDICFLKMMA